MAENMRQQLRITPERLETINNILLNPEMQVVNDFLDVVAIYGTPEEINQKAARAMHLPLILECVAETHPHYRESWNG